MPAVIVQIDGWDPVTSAAVTLRACSHNDPSVCHLDSKVWWPVLSKLPALRYDLFDGSFGTSITAPSSDLTLSIEPVFARYSLADAQIQLWTGEPGTPFAQWTRRMVGRLSEQPQIGSAVASVSFAVDDSWLDTPLLALYAGTTGAEGEAAQKGTPKPLALGAPRYVPGVMIDSINTILQLSSYGAVQGIDTALEKLSRFSASIGNYATFADLKAATIPPGRWATCLSAGLVRHGAPIEGQPSYLMRGDKAGSGGWVRLPGAIIKRIAEIAGAGDRVSAASLAALDVARPWPLSIWLDQQVTPRAIIQRIAASVNAVAGVSWLGELFVVPIAIGAPLATLNTDGSSLPQVGDVSQVVAGQPFWRLALQAERTWQVHALGDVAFTAPLVERGRYDPAETYREGNIVDLENGSRWLYAAATPSAGNAPSADSGYWSSLSGPVRATYDDGTPVEDLKPAQPGATAGAPAGTTIGNGLNPDGTVNVGELAEVVMKRGQVNTQSIIADALRQDDVDRLIQIIGYVDGQPVSNVFVQFRQDSIDGQNATNSLLSLLASKNESGTAAVLHLDTTQVDQTGKTLGQYLTEVLATSADAFAKTTLLQEALTEPDGSAYARAVLRVDANGVVGSIALTSNGDVSDLSIGVDTLTAIDLNNGQPRLIFTYGEDNRLRLDDVVINTLEVGSVKTANIAADSVTDLTAMSFPDQAVGPAEVTLAEITNFTVGDGVDGLALVDVQFVQDGTQTVDTSMRIRAYVNTGQGYVGVRDFVQGIQVTNGNARWALSQSFSIPIMSSGQASFKLTATGNSLNGGPTSGSSARNIQLNIFKGRR